jgi:pimeloyl-ACP methyl ester carboxylesterase
MAVLKRKHRCLMFDTRGVGRSQPFSPHASFEIDDLADDLHTLLEAAGISDAVLVGHETGALVAGACAERHPQDGRSLVLVSPKSPVSENDVKRLALFTPASLALRELATFPLLRNVVAWRFRSAPDPYRDILFSDFAELNPRAAYELALAASDPRAIERLKESVARCASRVAIICGEKDKRSVIGSRAIFSRVKVGLLATMGDCGFLPMLEYTRQFVRLVDEFAAESYRSSRTKRLK